MSASSRSSGSDGVGSGSIDLEVIKRTIDDDVNDLERDPSPKFTRSYEKWSPVDEGATLVWRDLNVYVKNKNKNEPQFKSIITNVTGAVKPGSLVALMGPSGAGKSTLMSALAHRTTGNMVVEGDILVNGRPIGPYMRHLSSFMHQDDLFVESLTVLEHMRYNARMKLDRRTPREEIERKIINILNELGLGHRLNTRIGSIGKKKVLSGGEKKRLAFATELLTDPPILFCDEPTTGLDSFSAQKIVAMMNQMAAKGKTVVCTIHQPSSQIFAMFSQIILLADGKIAYMGSTAFASDFFDKLGFKCPSNYNPADFFMRTLALTPGHEEASKQAIRKICNNFQVSDYSKEVDVLVQYEFHMGSAADGIALMVGLCFLGTIPLTQNGIQSLQGALVTIVCENTFPSMYAILAEFPNNIPLFIREYKSGMYSPGTFYIAKLSAMFPGLIVEPVIFTTIIYWMADLRDTSYSFGMSALTATFVMNVSSACGIFFSNAFDTVPAAMLCLIPFDFVLLITSGFFLNLSSLGAYISWTKYLSWMMYGMESLTILQWSDVHNITCENPDPALPCLTEGSQVIDKYSFSTPHFNRDIYSMAALCLIFYTLGFIALLRKITRN